MCRGLFSILLIALVMTVTSAGSATAELDMSGTWETHFFLAKAVAFVKQDGDSLSGVVYVIQKLTGSCDTYHFTGSIRQGVVEAAHHEGHSVCGWLVDSNQCTGLLTTQSKVQLKITALRCPNPAPARNTESTNVPF